MAYYKKTSIMIDSIDKKLLVIIVTNLDTNLKN